MDDGRADADLAICTVDDDGLVVAANEAAAIYLAKAMRDGFVGAPLARCLGVDATNAPLEAQLKRVLRGEIEQSLELEVDVAGARERVRLACHPLADGKRAVFFVRAADRADRALTLLADCSALFHAAGDVALKMRAFTSVLMSIADVAIVDVLDGPDHLKRVAVCAGDTHDAVAAALSVPPARDPASPIWRALDASFPIVVDDPDASLIASCVEAGSDAAGVLVRERATSAAFVPLLAHGQARGLLFVATLASSSSSSANKPRLAARDLPMFAVLAHTAASALEDANVRDVIEQMHKRHRTLLRMLEQEFRAQLAVSSLAVESIARKAPVDDRRNSKKNVDAIQRATTRMSATVNHLGEVFDLEPTTERFAPAVHPCKDIAYAVVEASAPFAVDRKMNVVVECADGLEVYCDRARTIGALSAIMREMIKRTTQVDLPILMRIERSGKSAIRFSVEHPEHAAGQSEPWAFNSDGPFDLFVARVLIALQQGALDVKNSTDGRAISAWLPARDVTSVAPIVRARGSLWEDDGERGPY